MHWLERAETAAPNHWQTLVHLSQARARIGVGITDAALLVRAGVLAPQVATVRLDAARRLLAGGDLAAAMGLLIPLANDPHAGGAAAESRRMLSEMTHATHDRSGEADAPEKPPSSGEATPDAPA